MSTGAPPAQVLRRCEHCGAPAQPFVCTICKRLNIHQQTTPIRRYVRAEMPSTASRWSRR